MLSAAAMRTFLALILPVCLAGCATASDQYPSLAIRDVERAAGRFEPAPPAPFPVPEVASPLSGSLTEQLAALGARARTAHAAFTASAPRAERAAAAAAGDAVGSPAWAAAQVALADLDSARSLTAVALAELDTLMVSRAVQAESLEAIEAVRQDVIAQVAAEDETLARLRARVR